MQTAINIAVTDINEQGGIHGVPLRLVTYDSAGTPERSAQFAERLILLDCAVGIVGLYHNGDAMAARMSPIAMVFPSSSPKQAPTISQHGAIRKSSVLPRPTACWRNNLRSGYPKSATTTRMA